MKFALKLLLCALIPLGSGCTSTDAKATPPDPSKVSSDGVGGIGGASGSSEASGAQTAAEAPKGPAYLLRYVDYKSGIHMELVNEAHTSHVDQYSKVRPDPSRKVTTDDWMKGLVEYLGDQGWSKEEKAGSAPAVAQGLSWSLQMIGPKGATFISASPTMKGAQIKRLVTMKNSFIQTYNATPGFQAVRAESDKLPFKVPEYGEPLKKKGGG
jgi:hypothetical protein